MDNRYKSKKTIFSFNQIQQIRYARHIRNIKRCLIAFVLFNVLSISQVQASEADASGKVLICPKDEMVVIRMSSDPLYTVLYDCYGNYIDVVNYPTGMGNLTTVKEGQLFTSEENGKRKVYCLGNPVVELASVPADTCKVETGDGWYGISTRNDATEYAPGGTWKLQLFDKTGNCFYEQVISDVSTSTRQEDYIVCEVDDQYFILWYTKFYREEKGEGVWDYSYSYQIDRIEGASEGGTTIFSVTKEDQERLEWLEMDVFGSYLCISDKMIDTSGNVILENVRKYGECVAEKERNEEEGQLLSVTVYDSELQKTEVPDDVIQKWNEEQYGDFRSGFVYDDVILNVSSDKMNGYACDGWFTEGGPGFMGNYLLTQIERRKVPYTRIENEGILALIDGEMVPFYMTEEEEPMSFNDDFYVTRITESGYRYNLVRSRQSGKILLSGDEIRMQRNLESYSSICFYLEESYIMETSMSYPAEVNVYRLSQNETGQEVLEKINIPGNYAHPWCKDLIYLSRGAYKGLVDSEGNWVVKLTDVNM